MTVPVISPDTPMTVFIGATDVDRARRFYAYILGLELVSNDAPFALVFRSGGSVLRVSIVEAVTPQPYTVLGWTVPDIRASVQALMAKGVTFNVYPGMEQDEIGLWQPPGSASHVAWFNDPDGNVLSLTG